MLGIIGGTALQQIPHAEHLKTISLITPFGALKSPIKLFQIHDHQVAIIARHGEYYQVLPHEVNNKANIWALKSLGVKTLLCINEASAINPSIQIGDLVIANDFIDLTKGIRSHTFFGNGCAAKINFFPLTNSLLSFTLNQIACKVNLSCFAEKLCVVIEGPRYNTFSESLLQQHVYHADIVGQTQLPELFLAREAQMHVASLNLITELDQSHADYTAQGDPETLKQSIYIMLQKLYALLNQWLDKPLPQLTESDRLTLENAILTPLSQLNQQQKLLLSVLKQ
jgi:5'-methylthioadenosine phosphorylase